MNLHKMRRIKQIFTVCLSLALVCGMLCALPLTATAAQSGTCGDNLTWTLDDNGLLTISGTGEMRGYNLDQPWEDYSGSVPVRAVQINDGVTHIGTWAFLECSRLESVTLPDSLISIGDGAFEWCSVLANVTIPASVRFIGVQTFYGCSALESITIPDSVTFIGDWAFNDCSSLKSITIPGSVTNIGENAFGSCSALERIQVDENNPNYTSVDGVLYSKDKTQLICCPAGKNKIEILNSVTSIEEYAFDGCDKLKSITIPNSVTSIGKSAFFLCGIESIAIPDGVTSIEEYTFLRCSALESVAIPDSVTSIGDNAFFGCDALKNIVIPDSVTSIGQSAFSYCYSLRSITLPDSLTSIGDYAFNFCSALTSVTIPASVTNIGTKAFSDCDALTLYGFSGSYAQEYANANHIPFVAGTMIADKFFTDVVPNAWYVDALKYAVSNELFNGISSIAFAPDMAMNRGMLVTVLWRAEGEPSVEGENPFEDVAVDKYYADAVLWASANDIVNGMSEGVFDPEGEITREQMATILYRYAQYKGYDVSNSGDLNDFPDGSSTSDYAATAIAWAYGEGVITGVKVGDIDYLDPQGGATRAQVATILMRYQNAIAQ